MSTTGVFPVHSNQFKVNSVGRTTPGTFVIVKDLETFKLGVEGKTEEWYPLDMSGWARQAVTGKKLTVSFTGKRNYGDVGNDYIASKLLATGQDLETIMEWTLPSGGKLTMPCVINLTSPAGGDSTNIDSLEFELFSDGLPVFTPGI